MSVLNEQGLSRLWGKIENNVKAAVQAEANARAEVDRGLREDLTELRNDFDEYQPPAYELVAEKHNPTAETGFIGLYNDYMGGAAPLAAAPDNGLAAFLVDGIHDGENLYKLQAEKALQDAEGHDIVTTYATKAALAEQIAALDGNITGNTGFVETISQTDGIVTATRRALKAEDIPSHKSATTDFGVGDAGNYGHLKLSDVFTVSGNTVTADNSNTNNGTAATPAAVKTAYDLAASNKSAIDEINNASTGILAQAKTYTDTELKAYSTTEDIAKTYETQEHVVEEIERVEGLISTEVEERAGADNLLQSQLDVLNGITVTDTEGDRGKSIRAISQEEVAKIVDNAPDKFDTLKEIAEWIGTDTAGAADIATDLLDVRKEVYGTNDGETPAEGKSRIDLLEEEVDDFKAEFASEINDISFVDINFEGSTSAAPNPVNADTLGGKPPEYYLSGGALEPTGVTAGTYGSYTSQPTHYYIPNITVDEYGRITEASQSLLSLASDKSNGLMTNSMYNYIYNNSSIVNTTFTSSYKNPTTKFTSYCQTSSMTIDSTTIYCPKVLAAYAYIYIDSEKSTKYWVPIKYYATGAISSASIKCEIPTEYDEYNDTTSTDTIYAIITVRPYYVSGH